MRAQPKSRLDRLIPAHLLQKMLQSAGYDCNMAHPAAYKNFSYLKFVEMLADHFAPSESTPLETPLTVERRERPTIMDGKVVTFAESFEPVGSGVFEREHPVGPFVVSASRNAVVVHEANCHTTEDAHRLVEAINQAIVAACDMGRRDRGNFR